MKLSRIKSLSEKQGYTWKSIADAVELTVPGLNHAIEKETLSAFKLEIISRRLNVSPMEFFDPLPEEIVLLEAKVAYGLATAADINKVDRKVESLMKQVETILRSVVKK